MVLSVFVILFLIIWAFHGFAIKSSGNYIPTEKEEPPIKGPNEKIFKNGTRV